MTPVCPPNYDCVFTPKPPRYDGPWWQAPHAWMVFLVAVIVVAMMFAYVFYAFLEYRRDRAKRLAAQYEAVAERHQSLALAEQHTMQLDACQGNPDMIKLVKDLRA